MKKYSEADKKAMEELVRERDILNKNYLKVSKYLVSAVWKRC